MALLEGNVLRRVAIHNAPQKFVEFHEKFPAFDTTVSATVNQLVTTKQLVHTADLQEEDPGSPLAKHAGARTLILVPLLKDDELVGVIGIYRQEVRPFTDKQIALVQNFAAQAVIAIENTRLLSELRESLEQQTATSEVLSVISTSPAKLEPVFQAMLENATRICEAKFGTLIRFEDGAARLISQLGIPPALAEFMRKSPLRPGPRNPLGRVQSTRQPVHIADYSIDQGYLDRDPTTVAGVELGGMRTLLVVPMLKDDDLIGAFGIYRQEVRPFSDKQIALMQNFAAQAVIAIENARLLNELRQRTTDLTDRWNSRPRLRRCSMSSAGRSSICSLFCRVWLIPQRVSAAPTRLSYSGWIRIFTGSQQDIVSIRDTWKMNARRRLHPVRGRWLGEPPCGAKSCGSSMRWKIPRTTRRGMPRLRRFAR